MFTLFIMSNITMNTSLLDEDHNFVKDSDNGEVESHLATSVTRSLDVREERLDLIAYKDEEIYLYMEQIANPSYATIHS